MMSVAIRIRAIPILSPSFPVRGADISADTPGTAAIIPLRNAMFAAVRRHRLINSARIGPTEPLQSWITHRRHKEANHQAGIRQQAKPLFRPGVRIC